LTCGAGDTAGFADVTEQLAFRHTVIETEFLLFLQANRVLRELFAVLTVLSGRIISSGGFAG